MTDLSDITKAKDLIDQLGSKMVALMRKEDDALHEVFRLKGTVKHLQDKLDKAVEALRYYAVEAMPWDDDDSLVARTVLAELEGEKK